VKETNQEVQKMAGVLTAMSIVSKRLADQLLKRDEEHEKDVVGCHWPL